MSESVAPNSRFGLSGTLRGIYVIRYFLFSGGTAIAFAMLERALTHSEHSVTGLIAGLLTGLVIFRSQMSRLFWPLLLLGQQAIYLIRRRRAVVVFWQQLKNISTDKDNVTLVLRTPMLSPQGVPTEAIRLNPRRFGTSLEQLESSLEFFFLEPSHRQHLPTQAQLREHLAKKTTQETPISSGA